MEPQATSAAGWLPVRSSGVVHESQGLADAAQHRWIAPECLRGACDFPPSGLTHDCHVDLRRACRANAASPAIILPEAMHGEDEVKEDVQQLYACMHKTKYSTLK
jgi:hypothetical protein